jgi:sec-independent protein translocase protein TatA
MQWEHILFVAIIALIFFGGKKIPEIMGGLGRGVKEFKKATKDIQEDLSIKD